MSTTRILLVDDDEAMRRILRLTLEQLGYEVTEAANGRVAIEAQRAGSFAVMLTDIVMPEKEGLETILEFRRHFPAVAIIAMSGGGQMPSSEYLKTAKLMGAREVLHKPFTMEELAAVLARVAPRSG